jgi:hypothetical protein
LLPAKPIPQIANPVKVTKEETIVEEEFGIPPKTKQSNNQVTKAEPVKVKPMKELKYEPNKVIIREKNKASEYIKQVEELFVKPKTKD